jgi:hypothetical protein
VFHSVEEGGYVLSAFKVQLEHSWFRCCHFGVGKHVVAELLRFAVAKAIRKQ